MVKSLEKYTFDDLQSYSSAEAKLTNDLLSIGREVPSAKDFETSINQELENTLQKSIVFSTPEIKVQRASSLWETVGGYHAYFACVALPPAQKLLVFEVESVLFKKMVYSLLGIEPPENNLNDPSSEVERGAFSFILLKCLKAMAASFKDQLPGQFQLARQLSTSLSFKSIYKSDDTLICIRLGVKLGTYSSYVRLVIPQQLFDELTKDKAAYEAPEQINHLGLMRAEGIEVPIRTQLGTVALSVSDLKGLEKDDIILLDHTSTELNNGVVEGEASISFGDPASLSAKGKFRLGHTGNYEVELQSLNTEFLGLKAKKMDEAHDE